jgi:hypothetical protein
LVFCHGTGPTLNEGYQIAKVVRVFRRNHKSSSFEYFDAALVIKLDLLECAECVENGKVPKEFPIEIFYYY